MEITIWQGIILGIIQGIAEWLPISSEAMVSLIGINFLSINPSIIIDLALVLHIGTLVSAIIYFRGDIQKFLKYPSQHRKEIKFLIISTFISLGLGGAVYLLLKQISLSSFGGGVLTILMGLALILTAWLLRQSSNGLKIFSKVDFKDAVILGLIQGIAVTPGISRSGSTVGVLLWRKFSAEESLRISFLMGIPLILLGGLLLGFSESNRALLISPGGIAALATTVIVGFITIKYLLSLAKKMDFSRFVFFIGVLAIMAGLMAL